MRKEILRSFLAVVTFTVLCGIVYPLAVTGVSQVAMSHRANGSMIRQNGKPIGSELIAQTFRGHSEYFQPRPSQTNYDPAGTAFNNAGPNEAATRRLVARNVRAYLSLEGRYNADLTSANLPVDAVAGSASGVDPHISQRNAEIQARRVAAVRNLPLARITELIEGNTSGRFLGLFGESGVNVLDLNLALDKERPR